MKHSKKYLDRKRSRRTKKLRLQKGGAPVQVDIKKLVKTAVPLRYNVNEPTVPDLHDKFISYIDLPGIVLNTNLQPVPDNTIICFLCPLNYALAGEDHHQESNFAYEMTHLTREKYDNLFQYRSFLRYMPSRTTIDNTALELALPNTYYSCFRNSFWYYPGQEYPDMKFHVTGTEGYGIVKNNLTHDINIDIVEQMGKEIKLSDILPHHTVTERYKIVIVHSSRNIENVMTLGNENLSEILKKEIATCQLNCKKDEDKIKLDKLQVNEMVEYPLRSSCGYLDYDMERFLNLDSLKPSDLGQISYDINLDGMIPQLNRIYDNIGKVSAKTNVSFTVLGRHSTILNRSDASYVGSLSPKLILAFLNKVLSEALNPNQYTNFINDVGETLEPALSKIFANISNNTYVLGIRDSMPFEMFEMCQALINMIVTGPRKIKSYLSKGYRELHKKFNNKKLFESSDLHLKVKSPQGNDIRITPKPRHLTIYELRDINLLRKISINEIIQLIILDSPGAIASNLFSVINQVFPKLESLVIQNSSGMGSIIPGASPRLAHLEIVNCNNLGDLSFIETMPKLQKLVLENCNIGELKNKTLQELSVSKMEVKLGALPHLKLLEVSDCPKLEFSSNLKIKRAHLTGISGVIVDTPPIIKNVKLQDSELNYDQMKQLFNPRALQSLHVEKCKISLLPEGDIFDVKDCKSLEFVFIAYNSGTAGLKIKADSFYYYSLKELTIKNNGIHVDLSNIQARFKGKTKKLQVKSNLPFSS